MDAPEIVLDTSVFLTALRSRRGASFELLSLVGSGQFGINISVPLVLEYEEVASREQWPGKPPQKVIDSVLDYLCAGGKQHRVHFLWRPHLRDPSDDMVLELAVAAGCSHIVTYNKRDFADAVQFGVRIVTPREFLELLGVIP